MGITDQNMQEYDLTLMSSVRVAELDAKIYSQMT